MSGRLHAQRRTDRKCPPDSAAKKASEVIVTYEGLLVLSGYYGNEG